MGSKIVYYFKQAFSSFFRNGFMTLASLVTVTSCLFLFSAFLLFGFNADYIGDQIQSQCQIVAYVDVSCTEAEAMRAYNQISVLPNVGEVTLETKDEALENFRQMLGTNAIAVENIDNTGFLRYSIYISMNDLAKTEELVAEVQKVEHIAEVKNRADVVTKVLRFTTFVNRASLAVMLLLTFISIFIISNTIKLAVHSHRKEIHIMKFVGATDRFIRWPFVLEGMLVGIISSAISLGLSLWGYHSLIKLVDNNFPIVKLYYLASTVWIMPLVWIVVGSVLLFGILMGMIGSAIAVRRHLKV